MKKLFTFLLLMVAMATVYAQSPGTWQSKGSGITATNRSMQGVSAVDSNIAWGITYHLPGTLATREFTRTIDGGNTWTSGVIDSAGDGSFTNLCIYALNQNTAWVAMTNAGEQAFGRIYKTTNGGQTWAQQSGSFRDSSNSIVAIHFFDANNGVTFGSPGTGNPAIDSLRIWITSNGGTTWNRIPKEQLPPVLAGEGTWINYGNGNYDVKGDTIWFGTRRGRIWRSTNKGASWTVQSINDQIFNQAVPVAFRNANNGIALVKDSGFRTKDGGNSWQPLSLPPSILYYQIEHVPGKDSVYFLSYEGSTRLYTDIRFAYSLDNGNNWILTTDPGVECFEFVSPTHAWGGGRVISPTQGGMYRWTGNLNTPDYLAVGKSNDLSLYTITTPKQLDSLKWKHTLTSLGNLPLTNVTLDFKVTKDGTTEQFQKTIATIAKGIAAEFGFDYLPASVGKYTFSVSASNAQLGANFYQSPIENFEVSDSMMARDDGIAEGGLGFGFGNPNWYGYYGSAFDLKVRDTLTAITVYIARGSNYNGSINLTVTAFDTTGRPQQELFHSERISLPTYNISNANLKLTYQLKQPVLLSAGKYVFAAGQDTLQGIVGFSFDRNNVSPDGFWLVSPIAGGGYPWTNATNREAMMIRPHFKVKATFTATRELSDITTQIKLSPNPFTDRTLLEFELKDNTLPVEMVVTDVLGRTLQSFRLEKPNAGMNQIPLNIDAPTGLLFLTLRQGAGIKTIKMIKQ